MKKKYNFLKTTVENTPDFIEEMILAEGEHTFSSFGFRLQPKYCIKVF